MSERAIRGLGAAAVLWLAGASASAQDRYPADITPPPGTRYPCALTALPHDVDVKALTRLATLYNIPFAVNHITADAVLGALPPA